MLHSAFLLAFMILAAPLAAYIPLAALAGVLLVVCWTMAEKGEFVRILKHWRPASVAVLTFALTLARDLTTGIVAGCVLAALFALLHRPVAEEGE
jgi:sulfate permease, SulP family